METKTAPEVKVPKKRKLDDVNDSKMEKKSDEQSSSDSELDNDEHVEEFKYDTKVRSSKLKVSAKCTSGLSKNCKKYTISSYLAAMNNCDKHEGKHVCVCCIRTPTFKEHVRESFKLKQIETFVLESHSPGSSVQVRAFCEFKLSPNCTKEQVGKYSHFASLCKKNDGKYCCFHCTMMKSRGINSPARKYRFDNNLLKDIDTEFKAYLLGWIASDGHLREDGNITIKIHRKDRLILEKIRNEICKEIPILNSDNYVVLNISSIIMNDDACRWLGLSFKKGESRKKSDIINFPDLKTDELKWHFIRGYCDGDGSLGSDIKSGRPRAIIASSSTLMISAVHKFVNLPNSIYGICISFGGIPGLVFMYKMYLNATIYLERKYARYRSYISWRPKKVLKATKLLLEKFDVLLK